MSATKNPILSVNDLERSENPEVFVINTTRGEMRGQVIVTVPKSTGGTDIVMVPATFLAINLTDQTTKEILLQSSDFRKAVARGLLTIVIKEEADRRENTSGAVQERDRLINAGYLGGAISNIGALGGNNEFSDNPADSQLEQMVSPAISALIEEFLAIEIDFRADSEVEYANRLRNLGVLKNTDLNFIKGKMYRVNKVLYEYAKSELELMQGRGA